MATLKTEPELSFVLCLHPEVLHQSTNTYPTVGQGCLPKAQTIVHHARNTHFFKDYDPCRHAGFMLYRLRIIELNCMFKKTLWWLLLGFHLRLPRLESKSSLVLSLRALTSLVLGIQKAIYQYDRMFFILHNFFIICDY